MYNLSHRGGSPDHSGARQVATAFALLFASVVVPYAMIHWQGFLGDTIAKVYGPEFREIGTIFYSGVLSFAVYAAARALILWLMMLLMAGGGAALLPI